MRAGSSRTILFRTRDRQRSGGSAVGARRRHASKRALGIGGRAGSPPAAMAGLPLAHRARRRRRRRGRPVAATRRNRTRRRPAQVARVKKGRSSWRINILSSEQMRGNPHHQLGAVVAGAAHACWPAPARPLQHPSAYPPRRLPQDSYSRECWIHGLWQTQLAMDRGNRRPLPLTIPVIGSEHRRKRSQRLRCAHSNEIQVTRL